MKKIILIVFILFMIGCKNDISRTTEEFTTTVEELPKTESSTKIETTITTGIENKMKRYGAFLGANKDNLNKILEYDIVSIELEEFDEDDIIKMKEKNIEIYAYLSVGSLEKYRDYYETFKSITFLDYDNWPDERWIDVSNSLWQNKIKELALNLKNDGANGVYMDNVDVYSIAKEYYGEDDSKIPLFYSGLKQIIEDVNDCGLNVMMNGGSDFLSEAMESNDDVLRSIYAYHQEEVFSLIMDYEQDVFSTQSIDDSNYYKSVIDSARKKGLEIFLLEYSKDNDLIKKIEEYCIDKYYYCASTVGLR